MIGSPDLVRCPVCGSRKIKNVSVAGVTETYCYCRAEGTVMESVDDRVATLVDPDEDRYSYSDNPAALEPGSVEPKSETVTGSISEALVLEDELDADPIPAGNKITRAIFRLGKKFRAKRDLTR